MPEKPSSSSLEEQESREREDPSFQQTISSFEKAAGPQYPAFENPPSEKELNEAERDLTSDNIYGSFSEAFRVNELIQQRSMLQRTNDIKKNKNPSIEDRHELSSAARSVTYHRYFPSIVHDMADSMRRYDALKATMNVLPPGIQAKEAQAGLYMQELQGLLEERTAFANVILAQGKLARHVGDPAQLSRIREELLAGDVLSKGSKEVLMTGGDDAIKRKGNELNQHIINILSGKQKIPGVDEGFSPEQLHIDLLTARYEQLLGEERRVVRDPDVSKATARMEELYQRQDAGETISEEDVDEYKRLQEQLEGRKEYLGGLAIQREEVLSELIGFTQALGTHQLQRAELVTLQEQFGEEFVLEGASMPNPDQTPEGIREQMKKNMEMRSEFHLGRMNSFLTTMEEDVLGVGIKEGVEHVSNKVLRPQVRKANEMIATIITSVLPQTFGLRDHAKESLTGPLNEALGWPPGKTEEELTPEERQVIEEKSKSILEHVREFDRTSIDKLQSTMSLISSMPDASNYVAEDVTDPLPTEVVTEENKSALMDQYGGATVYTMLFEQAQREFGTADPRAGFLGEYSKFLHGVNDNIGGHIDVAEAELQLSNTFNKAMWGFIIAAGAAGLIAGIGAMALGRFTLRITGKGLRLGGKAVRFTTRLGIEGSKKAVDVVRNTQNALRGLSRGSGAATRAATAAEKTAEVAAKGSKVGRVLGPLAIILAAVDLRRVTLRDARLVKPGKAEGVLAGIELMEQHGKKGSYEKGFTEAEAQRVYERDLNYLYDQRESLVMEDGAIKIVQHLRTLYPENATKKNDKAEELIERGVQLQLAAQEHVDRFHQLFPLQDYFVKDPKHERDDNIGIDIRNVNDARPRGEAFAKTLVDLSGMLRMNKSKKGAKNATPEELKAMAEDVARAGGVEQYMKNMALEQSRSEEDLSDFQYFKEAYAQYLEDAADFLGE